MRKVLHIILVTIVLLMPKSAMAQYYSINIDAKTAAAMVAAYGTGTAAEAYYNAQIQDIRKHYRAAEVAAAAIFSSKYLDRRALTDLGIWASATENYYYRRIYNMVSAKIMPKIWTVGGMMLRSPQNALYWGSYLMKICDDTKSLCMQFESVVTNSTLSFSDIAFLELNSNVADLLNLSELGDIDFRGMLDTFGEAGEHITLDNLKSDLGTLYQKGVSLAATGISNLGESLLQRSNFNDLFEGKIGAALTIVDNYQGLFQSFENNAGQTLLNLVGGEEGVANLFNISDYSLTSWIDDYAREQMGQYYTQRWYIYKRETGSETICNYTPPRGNKDITDGNHWYRISTSSSSFNPSSSQLAAARANSEARAGWSQTKVNNLNSANDGTRYYISYWLNSYIIKGFFGNVKSKAYAYSIAVTRSWDTEEEVYEDYFDSYSMDLNTFKAQLQARLNEMNENEEGVTYYIGSDEKNYYQTTDERTIEGVEAVTISVTCTDGAKLGEGSTQYKCSSCGSSLSAHTKECSMKTSIIESGTDTSELEAMESELRSKIDDLNSMIRALENENAALLKEISTASIEDAVGLRQKYNENKDKIDILKAELADYQSQLDEVSEAISEADSDDDVPTDDYRRIPALMQECQQTYGLIWQDAGSWSGYTFIRKAKLPDMNATVTFKAKLSIARKPKYFLWIKIHRAIVQIDWELTSELTSTQVVDVLTLDSSMSEKEKTDLVNNRVSEVARMYPSCKVSTEYVKSDPLQEDDTTDTYHLLWSSDRLEIAREIDSRITKIYADLVSLEKMMAYKYRFIDFLRDVNPLVDSDQGRKLTVAEECKKQWLENARKGKQDEE